MDYHGAKSAGIAGILAGVALAGELTLFTLSGFAPDTFNDAAGALAFLRDHGAYLRAAAVFGAVGVALTILFLTGLAAHLRDKTPMRAAATLYFGLLGNVGDGLVALSFWLGLPAFVTLSARDQAAATNAWGAFKTITDGFGGFGSFLLGFSLLAAGLAIIARGALPRILGWIAIVAGLATVIRVFTSDTPLAVLAMVSFFPSLLFTIVFRIWAGIALWRRVASASHEGSVETTAAIPATASL